MSKTKLKKHFSKSAETYDANASLQKYIEDKLIGKLIDTKIITGRVLDVGAGTGSGARKISRTFPETSVIACDIAYGMMRYAKVESGMDKVLLNSSPPSRGGDKGVGEINNYSIEYVTADMESLPFKKNTFDVVYSSSAVHWLNDLNKLILRVKEILNDDGLFCFSTFGDDTLKELVSSFNAAYNAANIRKREHVNRFSSLNEIILMLTRAGFNNIKTEVEVKKMGYPNARELLKSLKAIGSHKSSDSARFLGKDFLHNVFNAYESNFQKNGGTFATYVVYYFICGK